MKLYAQYIACSKLSASLRTLERIAVDPAYPADVRTYVEVFLREQGAHAAVALADIERHQRRIRERAA